MKLKPCPFCGSVAYLTDELPCDPKRPWQVFCRKDDCQATIDEPQATEDVAIELWNNRPGEKAARVEALEKARGTLEARHRLTKEVGTLYPIRESAVAVGIIDELIRAENAN